METLPSGVNIDANHIFHTFPPLSVRPSIGCFATDIQVPTDGAMLGRPILGPTDVF
jgi:hypothetical protein